MIELFVIGFGLILGSFYNVVIHRLPAGQSVVHPRSHCPACGNPISWWQNIPVLSFLLLRGRCGHCRCRISWRYTLVEALTAALFLLAWNRYQDLPLHAAATALFFSLLLILALIDLDHMILPDLLTLGGSLCFALYLPFHPLLSWQEGALAALAGVLIFLALYVFYLKIRKMEGMGLGDVKMVLLLGLFLGPQKLSLAILLASFSGMLVGLWFILVRRKTLQFALPYGTFLSLGSVLSLLFGDALHAWFRTLTESFLLWSGFLS